MYIDTHCHLNFKAFEKDLKEVIDKAQKAGIGKIIIPGAKIESSEKALEIARHFPTCYAAVGIHPHHAKSTKLNILTHRLTQLINDPKVVAIGEIGLDYHQYKDHPLISENEKKLQKELFILQLHLAKRKNLPVIIHCREAFDDIIEIVSTRKLTGVFHCFSGKKEHLEKILKLGFYVGFDGNITYPENENLRNLAQLTPLNRILSETDSPYLAPLPYRGQRNTPANLSYVIQTLVKIHKQSAKKIEEITYYNAINLFHL